jgi:hypothetical protein
MIRPSIAFTSVLKPVLTRACAFLLKFATAILVGPVKRYHPERHYMRGAGPRWLEKHGLNRPAAGK